MGKKNIIIFHCPNSIAPDVNDSETFGPTKADFDKLKGLVLGLVASVKALATSVESLNTTVEAMRIQMATKQQVEAQIAGCLALGTTAFILSIDFECEHVADTAAAPCPLELAASSRTTLLDMEKDPIIYAGREGHAEQLQGVGNFVHHKRMGQVVSTTQISYSERRHLLLIPNILCLEFCSGLSDPQARRGRARRVTEQKDHHRLRNRRRITVIARCLLFSNLRAHLERPALEPSDPLT